MKKKYNSLSGFLGIVLIIWTFTSCQKDNDAAPELVVSSITPTSGPKLTSVTLIGSGFSANPSENTVTINGKTCQILQASATSLTITIPAKAGSGNLEVKVKGEMAQSSLFTYQETIEVSTLAGGSLPPMIPGLADGTGKKAEFSGPSGIAIGPDGNLYVVDYYSSRIRKITPEGVVTTIAGGNDGYADGMGPQAKFYRPRGIAIAPNGTIYIADFGNNKIRTLSPAGLVSTLTGGAQGYVDGPLSEARFNGPEGIELGHDGTLYVVESFGNRVRKISPTGVVTTLAGKSYANGSTPGGQKDGTGIAAEFSQPMGIAIAADGSLYVTDFHNSKIRKITPQGVVTTVSGNLAGYLDGPIASAKFLNPIGLTVAADGTLFICDTSNDRIRTISLTGEVKTFAGTGPGNIDGPSNMVKFLKPYDVAISKEGIIYVTDGTNHAIRKITIE